MPLAKTLPCEDCRTDHQLVVSKLQIKLKTKASKSKVPARFNVEDITKEFSVEVKNRFEGLVDCEKCPEDL